VESSICTAAFAARRGGTVMVIGVGRPVVNGLPFMHLSLAEVSILHVCYCKISPTRSLTLTPVLKKQDQAQVYQPLPRHLARGYLGAERGHSGPKAACVACFPAGDGARSDGAVLGRYAGEHQGADCG